MSGSINLEYRPSSYFEKLVEESKMISRFKDKVLKTLGISKKYDELGQKMAEALHPSLMGGNYLPVKEKGEIEIAKILIKSTTFDVTSVFARNSNGKIQYRVVDEYEGNTLHKPVETDTVLPMTIGELYDYITRVWPFLSILEMNYSDDLSCALAFFSVESPFYPDIDRLFRERVTESYTSH